MIIGKAELLTLLSNIALLLIMSVAYETTNFIPSRFQRWTPWINGVVLSGICVVIMNFPFTLMPGLVYDTRSILISVTGLVFGLIPTILASVTAILSPARALRAPGSASRPRRAQPEGRPATPCRQRAAGGDAGSGGPATR